MTTVRDSVQQVSDGELVRQVAAGARAVREEAFNALVRRHVATVYGAARRQVGNAAVAEEVTQAVFLVLAEKAGRLEPGATLGAWLLKVTRYAAIDAMRKEAAVKRRERAVARGRGEAVQVAEAWGRVAPELDRALAALGERDREIIVLRYFEEREFAEMARRLGMTPEAVRKRTARAVAKLRQSLGRRGVEGMEAGVLESVMQKNVVMSVPPHVVAGVMGVLTGAAASTTGAAAIAKGAMTMMTWAKMKVAAGLSGVAVLAVIVGSGAGMLPRVMGAGVGGGGVVEAGPDGAVSPPPVQGVGEAAEERVMPVRVIEGGDLAAKVAGAFIEAFGKGDVEKVYATFADSYRQTRTQEGTARELGNMRAALDMESFFSVAVMVQPPVAEGEVRQAVAVSNIVPAKGAGARGPFGVGITLVWEKQAWRVRDIDMLSPGEKYEGFCEAFRKKFPASAYVDPISETMELAVRRFVTAMGARQWQQALALYMAPEEFAAAFEGPAADYEKAWIRQTMGKLEQMRTLPGATLVRVKEGRPGGEPSATTMPAGTQFGPFASREATPMRQNVSAVVKLADGREAEVGFDEVIQVKGSWRFVGEPRMR